MIQNALNDTFNIQTPLLEPAIEGELVTAEGRVIVPHDAEVDKNIDVDYEQTRNNLHSLLEQGQDALSSALAVAKQSEHPRAFEVVFNAIKQLSDINHQLLDLSKKRQELKGKDKDDLPTSVTNNAFFLGSTMELNKMIKNIGGTK